MDHPVVAVAASQVQHYLPHEISEACPDGGLLNVDLVGVCLDGAVLRDDAIVQRSFHFSVVNLMLPLKLGNTSLY